MNVLKARGCLIATALAIVLGIGAFSGAAISDVTDDIKALQRASKARAAIIKRISPAVVHIRVEKTTLAYTVAIGPGRPGSICQLILPQHLFGLMDAYRIGRIAVKRASRVADRYVADITISGHSIPS